jgi:hypothetical protein
MWNGLIRVVNCVGRSLKIVSNINGSTIDWGPQLTLSKNLGTIGNMIVMVVQFCDVCIFVKFI